MGKFQYRKKPVVIEAYQITTKEYDFLVKYENFAKSPPLWIREAWEKPYGEDGSLKIKMGKTYLDPNEDVLYLLVYGNPVSFSRNDWIIKGKKGELYPCKPDIFEETHEKV